MKTLATLLAALALLLPADACDRCFSEPPPQPADGKYTISAALPEQDCYWMHLAELRAGEDYSTFCRRAMDEYEATRKQESARREKLGEAAPKVEFRGYVFRNPAAPEGLRDISIPCCRRNINDIPGIRDGACRLFLSVTFSPSGIEARPLEGNLQTLHFPNGECVPGLEAEGNFRYWTWAESEAFLAALPDMLRGDKAAVAHLAGQRQGPFGQEMNDLAREQFETGKRVILFSARNGMPATQFWECLARMERIAGGDWIAHFITPPPARNPNTDNIRRMEGDRARTPAPAPEIELDLPVE